MGMGRMAGASPEAIALLRSLSPGLAAASATEVTALGDLAHGSEQGLTPEIIWNVLGGQLPLGGAAAGAAITAAVDPTVRMVLDPIVYGENARNLQRQQPGSDFLQRVEKVLNERLSRAQARGVADPRGTVLRGAFSRLGYGASAGAITAALPAIAAMTGDWPQWGGGQG